MTDHYYSNRSKTKIMMPCQPQKHWHVTNSVQHCPTMKNLATWRFPQSYPQIIQSSWMIILLLKPIPILLLRTIIYKHNEDWVYRTLPYMHVLWYIYIWYTILYNHIYNILYYYYYSHIIINIYIHNFPATQIFTTPLKERGGMMGVSPLPLPGWMVQPGRDVMVLCH